MREIQPVQRDFIQHPPRLPYGKLGGHIFAPNAYLRGNAFMGAAGKREERRGEKERKNKRLHCRIFRFFNHGAI